MSGKRGSGTKRELTAVQRRFFGCLSLVLIAAVWQLMSMRIGKSFLLPSPADVLGCLWENRAEIFLVHFPATLEVILKGGVLSVLIGAVFAVLMDNSSMLCRALYPILTATQTVPIMCLSPIFVLWFGYTVKMRVTAVVLVNFFSVTVNLYDGLASTDRNREELMRTFGAGRLQIFTMLKMPSALPYFFTALHVVVPWSVITAAVAEWLGAQNGLGTYSRACMLKLDAAGLIAPLIVLSAFALIMNAILNMAERHFLKPVNGGREVKKS